MSKRLVNFFWLWAAVLFSYNSFAQDVTITDVDFSDPICPSDEVSFDIILNNGSGGLLAFEKNFRIEVNGDISVAPFVIATNGGTVLNVGANTLTYPEDFAAADFIDFSTGNLYTVIVEIDSNDDGSYDLIHTENDIEVYVPDTPTLSSSDDDNIICEGDEITFTIEPLGANNYIFYLNGDEIQSSASNNITFVEGGVYGSLSDGDIITIEMEDENGCTITNTESITITVLDLPEGELTSDATLGYFCEGQNINFTATGGTSYKWYVEDTFSGDTDANFSTVIADGETVRVEIYNVNGCFSEESVTLNQASITSMGVIEIADNSICFGEQPNEIKGDGTGSSAVATVIDSDNSPEYQWQSSPDGLETSYENIDGATAANYQPGNLTQTTWYRRNVILSPLDCIENGDPLVINVEPLFNVELSSNDVDNSFCLNEAIIISATAGATNYEFFVNNVSWQDSGSRIFNLTASNTTSEVDLDVKNGDVIKVVSTLNDCDNETSLIIVIDDSELNPGWISDAPDNVICKNQEVVFTASGGNTYEFYINAYGNFLPAEVDGNVFTTSRITDEDIVYVRAYNYSGCYEEYSETFTVLSVTDPGEISFSNANDEDGICYGTALAGQIDGTAATVSDDVGYYWEISTNNGSTWNPVGEVGQNYAPINNFTTPTKIRRITYSYDNVDDFSYCNAQPSNELLLTVFPNYQLELSTGVEGDLFCSGDSVTITASEGADSYSWEIDGLADAGAVTREQTYTVGPGNDIEDGEIVQVTASFGECDITETIIINVDNFSEDVIPILISNATADAICANDVILFTAGPDVAGYTYNFYIGAVDGDPEQSSDNHQFTTAAIDTSTTVIVEVINGSGCSDTQSLAITVPEGTTPGELLVDTDGNAGNGGEQDTQTTICPQDVQPFVDGDDALNGTEATVTEGTEAYYWEFKIDNEDWEEIPGATDISLPADTVDISAAESVVRIKRVAYATVAGTTLRCEEVADEITINIENRTAEIASDDADNSVCDGEEVTFTLFGADVAGGDTIKWYINGVEQAGETDLTLITSGLVDGQAVYAEITAAGSGCTFDSNEIETEVVNPPVATLISNATGNTICAGSVGGIPFSDSVIFTAADIADATYQWYINDDPIVVADDTSHIFNTADTDFVFSVLEDVLIQEVKVIITTSTGCSDEATLDIYLNFANADTIRINGGGVTQNICFGTAPNAFENVNAKAAPDGTTDYLDADYANGATDTYRWEKRVNGGDWEEIPGANIRNLYQAPALIEDSEFRRVTISELNGKICEDASNIISITVAEDLEGGTTQRLDPDDGWEAETQVLCLDVVPNRLRVNGSSVDDVRYQWQFSEDNLTWTDITIANGFDIDAEDDEYLPEEITAADISSIYELTFGAFDASDDGDTYTIIIGGNSFTATVGEDASDEGGDADIDSTAKIIEILALRINASSPSDSDGNTLGTKITATQDGVSVLTITLAPGSDLIPDWDVTDTVLGDEDNDITSVQTHEGNSNTRYYRRSVYSVFRDEVLPACETFSDPIQITVNTIEPGVIENDNPFICYNEVPPIFDSVYNASSSAGGIITYQWQSWDGKLNTDYENIDGATDSNFIPEDPLTQTTYFRRVATSTLGVDNITCSENSNAVVIYVIPEIDTGNPLGFDGKICRSSADPLQVNATDTDWFDSLIVENFEVNRGQEDTDNDGVAEGDDLLEFRWQFSSTNDEAGWTFVHEEFADADLADWDDTEVVLADVRAVVNEQLRNSVDTDIEVELYFRLVTTRYFYDTDGDGDVDSDDNGCTVYSNSINITVEADTYYSQTAGPLDGETVCLGDEITPISYTWGGSTTGLEILNLPAGINSALSDSNGDGTDDTITFSGTPATTGFIRIQTLPDTACDIYIDSHVITVIQESIAPDYILVKDPNGVNDDLVLLNRNGLSYNTQYYLCAGEDLDVADRDDNVDAQDLDFEACYNSPFAEGLNDGFIWRIEPEDAGTIDGITGEVDWFDEFRGEAIISVTSLGCSGESDSIEIIVTVNEFDEPATVPTEPIPFELEQTQGVLIGGVPEEGESYSITLNGVEYIYDVQVGDDCIDIGQALVDLINNDLTSPVAGLFSATDQAYAPGDLNGNGLGDETGRRIIITATYEGYSAPSNPPDGPQGYGLNFEISTNSTSAPENAGARATMSIYNIQQSSLEVCNELVGAEPRCETNANTPDTQYFASSTGYSSIVFAVEDIVPGNGSELTPGVIDSATGVMNWNNDGFFGTFNVTAYAIGCDGIQTVTSSHAVRIYENLDAPEDIFYDLLSLPLCPAVDGDSTQFLSNTLVTWSIDNPLAGRINSVTGLLTWNTGFYGTVVVSARTYGCGGETISETITIAGPSEINRISAVNTENQRACMLSDILNIEYKLTGAATGANVTGLPNGISGSTEAREQITDITIGGDILSDNDDNYILTIDGIAYTVNILNDAIAGDVNNVTSRFAELIESADIGIDVIDNANSTFTLTSPPGVEFSVSFEHDDPGDNDDDTVQNPDTTQEGGIYFIISGAANVEITYPTTYLYTITTTGGACEQATKTGNITIDPLATLSFDNEDLNDQTVCNNNTAIEPILISLTGANVPLLTWDPPGGPDGIDNSFETIEQITTVTVGGDVLADTQISTVTLGDESLSDNGDEYSVTLGGVNYTARIGEQTDFVDLDNDGNLNDADDIIDELDDVILVLVDKINNDRDEDGDHEADDDLIDVADDNFNYTAVGDVDANTIEIILNPAPDGGTTFTISVSSDDPDDNDADSIDFETINSDSYTLSIDNTNFTVSIGDNLSALGGAPNVDTISEIVEAFVLLIEDEDLDITATNNGDDTSFNLTSPSGVVFTIANSIVDLQDDQSESFEIETIQEGGRFLTLTGTPTIADLSNDIVYTYTIQSAASDYGCNDDDQIAEIQGTITIKAEPQITLNEGEDPLEVCYGEDISEVIFEITGAATLAQISDLEQSSTITINGDVLTDDGDSYAIKIDTETYTVSIGEDGSAFGGANPIATIAEVIELFTFKINAAGINVDATDNADGETLTLSSNSNESFAITLTTSDPDENDNENIEYTSTHSGLPEGINQSYDAESQIVVVTLGGDLLSDDTVDKYTITINGVDYEVIIGEDASAVGGADDVDNLEEILNLFVLRINAADLGITAVADLDNATLTLTSTPGLLYTLNANATDNGAADGDDVTFTTTQEGGKFLTLIGSPAKIVEEPTTYTYVITTSGGICTPASYTGEIIVNPIPIITNPSENAIYEGVICNGSAMDDIVFELTNVLDWNEDEVNEILPEGIRANRVGNQIIISGTPNLNEDDIAIDGNLYEFTIRSTDNPYSCSTEVIFEGSFTLIISRDTITFDETSNGTLDDQGKAITEVCEFDLVPPIIFNMSEGIINAYIVTDNDDYEGLPDGLEADFDINSGIFTIQGIANPDVLETTEYNYLINGESSSCEPIVSFEGIINLHPNSTIDHEVASGDVNQIICDNTELTPIEFSISNVALNANITWTDINDIVIDQPDNLFFTYEDGVARIFGTPNIDNTETVVYNYLVETDANTNDCDEASISGTITVLPVEQLILDVGQGAISQEVCYGEDIDEIVFDVIGEDTFGEVVDIDDLPQGINVSFIPDDDEMGGELRINGSPTDPVEVVTTYTFTITTGGVQTSQCEDAEETITITVNPKSTLVFSGTNTSLLDQHLCSGESIIEDNIIEFTFGGGANSAVADGLPEGLEFNVDPLTKIASISGTPDAVLDITEYIYTVSSVNEFGCVPEIERTGKITVYPLLELIDWLDNITVTDETCFYSNDGSIQVQEAAIRGGVFSTVQIVDVTLDNLFESNDLITITITGDDGTIETFEYRVGDVNADGDFVAHGAGIRDMGKGEISDELAELINGDKNVRASNFVTLQANYDDQNGVIRFTAINKGIGFELSFSVDDADDHFSSNEVVENETLTYQFYWRTATNGSPNGELDDAISNSLNVENLEAGTYILTVVSDGGCQINSPEVIISEPDQISLEASSVCPTEIIIDVSGGTGPYTVTLWNQNYTSSVPKGDVEVSVIFDENDGVQAGRTYNISVKDINGCEFTDDDGNPIDLSIKTPTQLEINNDAFEIVQPTCSDNGSIKINNNAFSITGGSGDPGDFSNLSFIWTGSNGNPENNTNPNIYNLGPGEYILTVIDNTCSELEAVSDIITLTGNTEIEIEKEISETPVYCGDGFIDLNISGGSGDGFSVEILNQFGISQNDIEENGEIGGKYNFRLENIYAGTYIINVTDDTTGCQDSTSVEIEGSISELRAVNMIAENQASFLITDLTCYESGDGSFEVEFEGGTPPFEYSINGGVWTSENFSTKTISVTFGVASTTVISSTIRVLKVNELDAGDYDVRIRDRGGVDLCFDEAGNEILLELGNVSLSQPDQLEISEGEIVPIPCEGGTGSIEILISGGSLQELNGIENPNTVFQVNVLYPNGNRNNTSYRNGEPSLILENLNVIGEYLITVTDANQCQTTLAVYLDTNSPDNLAATAVVIPSQGCSSDAFTESSGASIQITSFDKGDGEVSGYPLWQRRTSIDLLKFTISLNGSALGVDGSSIGLIIDGTTFDASGTASITSIQDLASNLTIAINQAPNYEARLNGSQVVVTGEIIDEISSITTSNTAVNLTLSTVVPHQESRWVEVPGLAGLEKIENLQAGIYRGIIRDGSGCGGTLVQNATQGGSTFQIDDPQSLQFDEIEFKEVTCSNPVSSLEFKLTNGVYTLIPSSSTYELTLNSVVLKCSGINCSSVSFSTSTGSSSTTSSSSSSPTTSTSTGTAALTVGNTYTPNFNSNKIKIDDLPPGNYELAVKNIQTECIAVLTFSIDEPEVISYAGETEFIIDPCYDSYQEIFFDHYSIEGGRPFVNLNGEPYYSLVWKFYPQDETQNVKTINSLSNSVNFTPKAGRYELFIRDVNGCSILDENGVEVPIEFSFTQELNQLVVNGTGGTSGNEFSQPVSCEIDANDGQINIEVLSLDPDAIVAPFNINWHKQGPNESAFEQRLLIEGTVAGDSLEVYSIRLNEIPFSYITQVKNEPKESVLSELTQIIEKSTQFTAQLNPNNENEIIIQTLSQAVLNLEIVSKNSRLQLIKSTSNIAVWIPLDGTNGNPNFNGFLDLDNLSEGLYRYTITSATQVVCENNSEPYSLQGVITVENENVLEIREGPIVDEYLCNGQAGTLFVDVFDGNTGPLTFFYNDAPVTYERVGTNQYIINIDNPVETSILEIYNASNCGLAREINIGNGTPLFDFTSTNFEQSGGFLAREDITFTDLSENEYVDFEFDFGDGNQTDRLERNTPEPITHEYAISGTYFVKLRIFNDLGCTEELVKSIKIGKGYSILMPNVFTPNGDIWNATFRPIFNGLSEITLRIYDAQGSLLYEENGDIDKDPEIEGLSLIGWDGANEINSSPYFIYTITAKTIDEQPVFRDGTFIIIR